MARDKFGIELRKRIIADFQTGMTQKGISAKYSIHKSTISRIIKRFVTRKEVAVIHRGGRTRKTSQRTDNLIVQLAKKNPEIVPRQIIKDLNLQISTRSVRRRLLKASLRGCRPAHKPMISMKNKAKRLKFAKEHLNWPISKWKTVLFSDESKFNLIGSDGMSYVRRPVNKRYDPRYCKKTVKHGEGNIMVWGCFSANGVGPLHKINGIMDRYGYKNILEDVMLPYAEWEMPVRWVFQQDNDPKHTVKYEKSWFTENKVDVMEWPPQSPDLNPIENLWELVNRRIDWTSIRNGDELFNKLQEAWKSISMKTIDNLIASMPKRCAEVIKCNGFATKY